VLPVVRIVNRSGDWFAFAGSFLRWLGKTGIASSLDRTDPLSRERGKL
jgi:hypothetical protein